MNVLLTGATGFVGTAVIQRFLRDGAVVTAAVLEGEDVGRLPAEVRLRTIEPLSGSSNYSDVVKRGEVIVHLAARVHVMNDTSADPLEEFRKVNVHGTERLAREAAAAGARRFVFVSSVKVHGEESPEPYLDSSPRAPLDPYGVSKSEAEDALRQVAADTGLEVAIIRPPLVYGPGVKANFRQLLSAVNRGVPLPFGSIRNRRSLIYVENLADAIVRCAVHEKATGRAFLVSDGDDVSTPELIRRIAQALGRPPRLVPFPPHLILFAGRLLGRTQTVERLIGSLQVDSSLIQKELSWSPPFTMMQGLEKTARWLIEQARPVEVRRPAKNQDANVERQP